MKGRGYISVILSLMSLVISIVCLCRTYPRELGFDYLGWIVGILALLITILIGWQIYTVVDVRNSQKRYKEIVEEVSLTQHGVLAEQELVNWLIYYRLVTGNDRPRSKSRLIYRAIACLYHYSCLENWELCNYVADALIESIETIDVSSLPKEEREELLEKFLTVKGRKEIEKYAEILSLLCGA